MKKLFFHSFISVLLFLCSCKTKDDFVAIDAKYEFLNYLFKSDSPINVTDRKFIADRDTTTVKSDYTIARDLIKSLPEGIFTIDDLDFLEKQLKEEARFSVDPSLIKGRVIVKPNQFKRETPEMFWVKILDKYKTYEFSSVSMPIFSKDLETVFIEISNYRFAKGKQILGAVYKKKEGKWAFYDQVYYYE